MANGKNKNWQEPEEQDGAQSEENNGYRKNDENIKDKELIDEDYACQKDDFDNFNNGKEEITLDNPMRCLAIITHIATLLQNLNTEKTKCQVLANLKTCLESITDEDSFYNLATHLYSFGFEFPGWSEDLLSLHHNIQKQNISKVQEILSRTDPSITSGVNSKSGLTTLQLAISTGNYDILELIVLHKISPLSNRLGEAELFQPIVFSESSTAFKSKAMQLLKSNGWTLCGNDSLQALCNAVKSGHLCTVKYLLDLGCQFSGVDIDGMTALHWAARYSRYGHGLKILGTLLSAGFSVDVCTGHELKYRPVHEAIRFGTRSAVMMLLDAEENTLNFISPMHIVVQNPRVEEAENILWLLQERGFDINAEDDNGQTPLHHAASRSDVPREFVTMLCRAGSLPSKRDRNGKTALNLTFDLGAMHKSEALCPFVIEPEDWLDKPLANSLLPLSSAIRAGNSILAAMLLNLGANPDLLDDNGIKSCPLQWALAVHLRAATVELLFSRSKTLNTFRDIFGKSLLQIAAQNRLHYPAMLLLKAGVDIDASSRLLPWLSTPLALAIIEKDLLMVELLLEGGADPTLLDKNGNGYVHLISEGGCIGALKLLLNRGQKEPLAAAKEHPKAHLLSIKRLLSHGVDTFVLIFLITCGIAFLPLWKSYFSL